MRFILLAAAAVFLAGCCGQPTMTLRNPLLFDQEPATVAGPRGVVVPQTYVPQYTPQAAPAMPFGYTAPRADPCK